MNIYDATEIAYKNGYRKGVEDTVREMVQRLKDRMHTNVYGEYFLMIYDWDIDEIAKEMLGGSDNATS